MQTRFPPGIAPPSQREMKGRRTTLKNPFHARESVRIYNVLVHGYPYPPDTLDVGSTPRSLHPPSSKSRSPNADHVSN
eukprot:762052-Hanusia_phi.AAC.1